MRKIMVALQNKQSMDMSKQQYTTPTILLFYYAVEQGFGASQGSPDVNIGIGPWEEENEDYNIK